MTALFIPANLTDLPPEEQARMHLAAVVPPLLAGEAIEIRCLNTRITPATKGPRFFAVSIDEAVKVALDNCGAWDVFFGVGTRACPDGWMLPCAHAEKGKDHVGRFGCIWGDFDTKTKSFEQVRGELESLPPDVLVASGKGLHAYWRLTEPASDQHAIETLNKSLRTRFGGDNAVDASRILRVAGTFNYKYDEPLPVRLVSCNGL